MSTIVYRISVLLGVLLAEVPVGTNLGLFWLLWALISGRFLLSRGAIFPALADGGLPAEAVRRSGAALAYGRWAIQTLIQAWHHVVQQEGYWQAHRYEGFRPVACDLVGFFRPRLSGCLGKHYHSGADKALPAVVCAVVAAVGSLGKVRFPLVRLILHADPGDQSEADLQRRAVTQASATLQRDEVLVVDAGFSVAALLTADGTRFVARVARNFRLGAMSCRPTKAGDVASSMGSGSVRCPAPTKERGLPRRLPTPPRSGWWAGGCSRPKSGTIWCRPPPRREGRPFGVWSSTIRATRNHGCWRPTCQCRPTRCGVCTVTAGRSSRYPWRPRRWQWPRAFGIGIAVRRVGACGGCSCAWIFPRSPYRKVHCEKRRR